MISGIGGGYDYAAKYSSMVGKLDADADGQVTKAEFVNGAPQGVSSEMATSLFDILDTQKSGAINDGDLASAFAQLSDVTRSLLIQTQSADASGAGKHDRGSELFSKLDADGNGSVTREEFVAGRPPNISEDQASQLFDKVSGDNGDSLTEAQFIEGFESLHANASGGRGGPGGGKPDAEETFDKLDTNKDGIVSLSEFLAGRPDNVSEEDATKFFSEIVGEAADSGMTKDQFVQGMENRRSEDTQATNASDPNELLKQLLAALQESNGTSTAATQGNSLEQFVRAIDAYRNAALTGDQKAA